MRSRSVLIVLVAVAFVAGCSYTLPTPLQQEVDQLTQQTEGVYGVVQSVKGGGGDENVEKKYSELVQAHDEWLGHVKRVISKEIQYFEKDEKYQNSVVKLDNAAGEFEKAADAARGEGASPADVPDWPVEARELMTQAYNQREMKKAAAAIFDQLRIKRWNEIDA